MSLWCIAGLDKHHHRDSFDCGEESLNVFLQKNAGQNAGKDISRTYVAVAQGTHVVSGFYTLSSGSIAFARLPAKLARRLPKYPVPTAHLGRLAVDRQIQGQGLGGILLMDALLRIRTLADQIGIHAVTVHALHDRAADFYRAYGFLPLNDDRLHLYLPMATIRTL